MSDTKETAVANLNKPSSMDHEAPVPVQKTGKRKTCMRHCKRFWWIYLIAFCCIVVLVVCLIIFVAVPKIAQHKMDDAKLEVKDVKILRTESDKYLMELSSIITTDGSIHANIDAFDGVMYLEDLEGHKPFTAIRFPKTTSDKYQEVNVSQEVNITDMDAFTTFNIWFASNETLRVTVEGKTKVKPRGLTRKYGVTFRKTVEIKGLNTFKGTTIVEEDSHILDEPDDQGRNFRGVTVIPNPTVFTLAIGNATFDNFIEDTKVGTLYIENFDLVPGDNRLNVTAELDRVDILTFVREPAYCKTGIVPLKLQGTDVHRNGQDLSYFAAGLANGNQTVEVDIASIVEDGFGFRPECPSNSTRS